MDANTDFQKFMADEGGEYCKARFLSLAREILAEGRRPERVFNGMFMAALLTSMEPSTAKHMNFIRLIHENSVKWQPRQEALVERMVEARMKGEESS